MERAASDLDHFRLREAGNNTRHRLIQHTVVTQAAMRSRSPRKDVSVDSHRGAVGLTCTDVHEHNDVIISAAAPLICSQT